MTQLKILVNDKAFIIIYLASFTLSSFNWCAGQHSPVEVSIPSVATGVTPEFFIFLVGIQQGSQKCPGLYMRSAHKPPFQRQAF